MWQTLAARRASCPRALRAVRGLAAVRAPRCSVVGWRRRLFGAARHDGQGKYRPARRGIVGAGPKPGFAGPGRPGAVRRLSLAQCDRRPAPGRTALLAWPVRLGTAAAQWHGDRSRHAVGRYRTATLWAFDKGSDDA